MIPRKENDQLETIYTNLQHGINNGVLHLSANSTGKKGEFLNVRNKNLINFSSYSYLGLEKNQKLIKSCIEATQKYGTQFGYSRAFISIDLYDELESLLSQIYSGHVVLAPSTTLAHQSAMPVLMDKSDLIIIDQFAHASMYYSVKAIRDSGAKLEILRHNRIDLLEEKIQMERSKYRKIWYVADGVYSMQGDYSPVKELKSLMDRYEHFNLYIDDAHGMSWCGENGKGYVLSKIDLHDQMILVTSLNKAFASSGGAIILKSKEQYRKIRTCGGTLIFSTPIQPPMLGTGIASAKIHLSDEISTLQKKLKDNIQYCNQLIFEIGIPDLSASDSPVFFLPTAFPKVCYSVAQKMMNDGFYVTPVLYPAVSMRRAGIRFCISSIHSKKDIRQMLYRMKTNYVESLEEGKVELKTILRYFKIDLPKNYSTNLKVRANKNENNLELKTYRSINEINQGEWNRYMENEGLFDSDSMNFLEQTFKSNDLKENNWDFHYLVIRENGVPVLITFFTKCWCKDDIFKSNVISRDIEEIRTIEPYYLTTESLMMGSLITEGNHLYVNRKSKNWKKAIDMMLQWVDRFQYEHDINAIYLRDFNHFDFELSDRFISHGLVETDLPDYTHSINMEKHGNVNLWWESLGSKKRQHIKRDVLNFNEKFDIIIKEEVIESDLEQFYQMYLDVKNNSLEINTFSLPFKFFRNLNNHPKWEMIILNVKGENQVGAVVFSYKSLNNYTPLVMGVNYDFLHSHKVYKQALYQMVKRGQELNSKKIFLGITSSLNKRRLGAIAVKKKVFVGIQDTYNAQVLSLAKENE